MKPASQCFRHCVPIYALALMGNNLLYPQAPPHPGWVRRWAWVCGGSVGVTVWAAWSAPVAVCRAIWPGSIGPHVSNSCCPWVGGGGGAAVPVGLMRVCYVSANLQEQDSKSNSPSGTPKYLSEPRHLEHSHALLRTPPMSAPCEKPSRLEHVSCIPASQ